MKKLIALLLVFSMLLCGCSGGSDSKETTEEATTEAVVETTEEAVTEAATEPTVVETTVPEVVVYTNPLNGEVLDAPYTGRIFAVTISNIEGAIPHVGTMQADILMEMFVNGSIIRCLALFSDPSGIEAIGSVRSCRLMFNDIVQHYDAIFSHAGGSGQVLADANARGIDHMSIDLWDPQGASFRDEERKKTGYEHSLFAIGSGLISYAENEKGYETTRPEGIDYGLNFAEDGTPADGETANTINITFTYNGSRKDTSMLYNQELDKYVFHQYGEDMVDGATGEPECFTNVVIMQTKIWQNNGYHEADFVAGGEGWYANGGKIIPITWTCADEDSPFEYFTADGEPLDFGVGNTYIAIAPVGSPVSYE